MSKIKRIILCGIVMAIVVLAFMGCGSDDYGGVPEDKALKMHEDMVNEADQREVVPDPDN